MVKPLFAIFTIPLCPYCSLVKKVLRDAGFVYTQHILNTQEQRDEFKATHMTKTFPQVFAHWGVDHSPIRIGGCDETTKWIEENKT